MSALVIIPTYNEAENLPQLVKEIFAVDPDLHLLVVDDNSPDGTGALAEGMAQTDARVQVMRRAGKLGLGTAYLDGFRWALQHAYQHIVQMDADFSHDPAYLPAFLDAMRTADLAIGSRYIPGGATPNWGTGRRLLSRGGSIYTNLILGLGITDCTSGFKCWRREVLEAIDLGTVQSNGYSFQIEMNYRARLKGFRIREVPIVFVDRRVGQSKMSKEIVREAMLVVPRLALDGRRGRLGRVPGAARGRT